MGTCSFWVQEVAKLKSFADLRSSYRTNQDVTDDKIVLFTRLSAQLTNTISNFLHFNILWYGMHVNLTNKENKHMTWSLEKSF